jgi:sterol desaturase/sphingolipid hydroxylase (fatty acid hydroxylase superfamily)
MLQTFLTSLAWFAFLGLVWSVFAKVRPCTPGQPLWRAGWRADLVYWFVGPFVFAALHVGLIALTGALIFPSGEAFAAHMQTGLFGLRGAPLWVQVIAALIISDFLQYWTHRLFHTPGLWRFHAIHHGPAHVDWLSSARFHPVNTVVHSTAVAAFVTLLGFDPLVFAILAPFNVVYSTMVHANVNWDFGPLRAVFASPVFHRWHHSSDADVRDKNFAPTFPVFDILFGTYHMPQGRRPQSFGVPDDPVPETLIGQLAYPFRPAPDESQAQHAAPAG